MSKPSICINIGGATNGLWSANSSEHRYPQAIAQALASQGYQIDCVGTGSGSQERPRWGIMPPLPNVNLYHESDVLYKEYDILIGIPWEHGHWTGKEWSNKCDTYPIKAKLKVHLTFGWHESMVTNYGCYDRGHILAYPRLNLKDLPTPSNPYKYVFLPIPIGEAFLPVNPTTRKTITWSSKDVFHPDWYPDRMTVPNIGLATLKALARLAAKCPDLHVNFFGTRYFDYKASELAARMGVQEVLQAIPNKTLHGFVPHNVLCELFKTSRITTPISGMWSSFGESLCCGSVSLAYGNKDRDPPTSPFEYFSVAHQHGVTLDHDKATEDDIYKAMEAIYLDDTLYLELIDGYRQCYEGHLYKAVVDQFEKEIVSLL